MAIVRLYIGETLAEVLPRIEETNIKLGTADGGAFFYCGPVKDMSDILKTMNVKAKHEHEERIVNNEANLENAMDKVPNASDYIKKAYKSSKGKSAGDILGYINYIDKEIQKVQARIDKLQKMKKEKFVKLEDRVITDSRTSIDEADTKILIIEGREIGRYWSIYEYEHGMASTAEEDDDVQES